MAGDRDIEPTSVPAEAVEAAARALCRIDGHPENTRFEGKPMWQSYMPEAEAAVRAALPHLRLKV